MALQLPPPPCDPHVPLPRAPAHPPTLANIYEAHQYTNSIIQSNSKLVIHLTSAMLTMSHQVVGYLIVQPLMMWDMQHSMKAP